MLLAAVMGRRQAAETPQGPGASPALPADTNLLPCLLGLAAAAGTGPSAACLGKQHDLSRGGSRGTR